MFKDQLDPNQCTVVDLPSLVLVLGGVTSIQTGDRHRSLRNVFVTRLQESDETIRQAIRMPEQFPEWNQFEGYSNLVDFEIDASSLCRAILLFAESSGSLAELGAFSMSAEICEKTITVIQKKFYDRDSFIKLGPIRRMEDAQAESVCVIHSENEAAFENEYQSVLEILKAKFDAHPKKSKFNLGSLRDVYLLIADLVELFGALTIGEISDMLGHFNVPINSKDLKKALRQLALFELIKFSKYLTQSYYVANHNRQSFIDYNALPEKPKFDRVRFKLLAHDEMKGDHKRRAAYEVIHEPR